MNDLKISISTNSISDYKNELPLSEVFSIIKHLKINNIELSFMSCNSIKEIKFLISEWQLFLNVNNINICAIHLPFNCLGFNIIKKFAQKNNIQIAIIHPLSYNKSKKIDLKIIKKQWNKLINQNDDTFLLCLENLPLLKEDIFVYYPIECTYKSNFFSKKVNKHKLGITFDTTHFGENKENLITAWNNLKQNVKHIHISDYSEKNGRHLVLGTGRLKLKKFLKEIKKSNYDGFISIELHTFKTNKDIISALKKSIEFIKTIIL